MEEIVSMVLTVNLHLSLSAIVNLVMNVVLTALRSLKKLTAAIAPTEFDNVEYTGTMFVADNNDNDYIGAIWSFKVHIVDEYKFRFNFNNICLG